MQEPSILDYLKSFFSSDRIKLKDYLESEADQSFYQREKNHSQTAQTGNIVTVLISLILAFSAQIILEFSRSGKLLSLILYFICGVIIWRDCFHTSFIAYKVKHNYSSENGAFLQKPKYFYFAIPLLIGAFISFSDNQFTLIGFMLWIIGITSFFYAFWHTSEKINAKSKKRFNAVFIVILAFAVSAFFRYYLLQDIPGEMFSDHAEKLLDVMDILDGSYPIYFPRNTGREAIQFYLTAALIHIFNLEIGFFSLKLGMAMAGFLTLPFIYLLGRYLFNNWVGITSVFFAGIAYWPNVISRIGLRFPLYPLFAAPVIYFLIKGLEERDLNQILLSGVFLGIGLHGYSPFRIVPILVGIIFIIYSIYMRSRDSFEFALNSFALIAITAFIVFLPLFRYILDYPTIVNYRSLSRITGLEKQIEGQVIIVFLKNLWDALTMFFLDNGVIWVNSIPNRPALGIVSAVFLFMGTIILIKQRSVRKDWKIAALILSIPVLMLPSILSLAYPGENPALNRSSGAIIPVFIIVGVGFCSIFDIFLKHQSRIIKNAGLFLAFSSIVISLFQNYDLIFNKFSNQFSRNAWNSSEIGRVIAEFAASGNDPDNAFVIPYPHWVDTRLVGINADFPRKDYALWSDDLPLTVGLTGNKLFILKPEDQKGMDALELIYPHGKREFYYSKTPGKNFVLYRVLD